MELIITTKDKEILLFLNSNNEQRNAASCPDYELLLEGKIISSSDMDLFEINNLKPFTRYNLTVRNKYVTEMMEISLTTEEGAPRKVRNIQTLGLSSSSVSVSWFPPDVANGKIRYYKIYCEHTNYFACNVNKTRNPDSTRSLDIESPATSTLIEGLLPYSEYAITIAAYTIMRGEETISYVLTQPTKKPESSEIPAIGKVTSGSTTSEIVLEEPNCILMKGPMKYYSFLQCTNAWCLPMFMNASFSRPLLMISNLIPYSDYVTLIQTARDDGQVVDDPPLTVNFRTKSSVPHTVTNVVAFSKSETALYLRFPKPFPPTGELFSYKARYCYGRSIFPDYCEEKDFLRASCILWENLECITIEDLYPYRDYIVTIQAKNMDTGYNEASKRLMLRTEQEVSDPPENINAIWDNYHNLTVTWTHPSITNGPLTKFQIQVFTDTIACYDGSLPIDIESYSSMYTYTIPFTNCYSSTLTVEVFGFNKMKGKSAKLTKISPPPTPSLAANPVISAASNISVTLFLPMVSNLTQESSLFIVVSKEKDLRITLDDITADSKDTWLAAIFDSEKIKNVQGAFTIGNDVKTTVGNRVVYNRALEAETNYTVGFLMTNQYGSFKRSNIYNILITTTGMRTEPDSMSSKVALLALLLLLIIPAIYLFMTRTKKGAAIRMNCFTKLGVHSNNAQVPTGPDVIPLTEDEKKPPGIANAPKKPKRKILPPDSTSMNDIEDLNNIPSPKAINNKFSKPVKIIDFENYVKEAINTGELERQHQLFPRGQTKPWDYGLLPQNKSKNRYNNLIAYDHTRVKLTKINNDSFSDYINANYIEGVSSKKGYIATQGPKVATVNDFWRMIWQEKVNYIVMVANVIEGGKKKTEQYWPNINEFQTYDKITVEYISTQVFADYEYRTFLVIHEDSEEKRQVEQLHFTSWPDHGVPLYSQSLVPFLRKILAIPQGTSAIVVHCSAGVGRTGTIILIDLCLRMAAREGSVDVLKHQANLREQRANLVDNIEQYKLAHLVLLECLIAPETSIGCDEKMEAEVKRIMESGKIERQIQYLEETAWQDQAMRPVINVEPNLAWSNKNRFQDIIPTGYGRVYISRYPVNDEHSDYINAVEVDGFRAPQKFICTQQPLLDTVGDFWRMIDEKDIPVIVSLNKINTKHKDSCIFWPNEKLNAIQPVPYLKIIFHKKSSNEYFTTITVHLHNNKNKKHTKRNIHILVLKGWLPNNIVPPSEDAVLKLWDETERLSRGDNPTVITCFDGAKACGLFTALSFMIEKIKLEQMCDICLAIRTVRHNRKQFVTDLEQFVFLYQAALCYVKSFELYANFSSLI